MGKRLFPVKAAAARGLRGKSPSPPGGHLIHSFAASFTRSLTRPFTVLLCGANRSLISVIRVN